MRAFRTDDGAEWWAWTDTTEIMFLVPENDPPRGAPVIYFETRSGPREPSIFAVLRRRMDIGDFTDEELRHYLSRAQSAGN